MSVVEFNEKSRRAKWEEQWRTWSAKKLGGSSVEETIEKWRGALEIVNKFSGLEYCKVAKTEPEYVDLIVKTVTRIIPLLIPLSKEGVCGKHRLCQIVDDMYKKCTSRRLSADRTTQATFAHVSSGCGEDSFCRTMDVVGIYGFTGLGKTMLCRSLHDFYFGEFNGMVCYIDLGCLYNEGLLSKHSNGPFTTRMLHMLSTFTNYTNDYCYYLDVDQVKELLRERLFLLTYPIFLAIDINILRADLDQLEAREEAEFYLGCEFPEGSKIFITSRSQDVLENLTNQHDRFSVVIEYMPPLLFEEARDIFVHEMPNPRNFGISKIEDEVNDCVKMCIIEFEGMHTPHYHPLMLKTLAASVKRDKHWKENFRMLQSQGIVYTNDALEKVFKILDFTFATLKKQQQKLFLDFALFYNVLEIGYEVHAWIKRFYSHIDNNKLDRIFLQLKELYFIEENSWRPPNLVVEFCRYKVTQGEYAQYYEVVEANACWRDVIPRSVRYVSISRCGDSSDRAWPGLDLRDVEALEVLHLMGIDRAVDVLLSRTTCAHLRSLIVRVPPGTSLHFVMDENGPSVGAPIQPHKLFRLELAGDVRFKSSRFCERICLWLANNAGFQALPRLVLTPAPIPMMDLSSSGLGAFRNLEVVSLSELPSVRSIDVTTCSNLKDLTLSKLPYLRSIGGLNNLTSFERFTLMNCNQLPTLAIGANAGCHISSCRSLKRISFCTKSSCPGAESSRRRGISSFLGECPSLKNIDGLSQRTISFRVGSGAPLEETFGELLEAAAIDSSICKAKVDGFTLTGQPPGLAGLSRLCLLDAQHIGLFISALTKAVHLARLNVLDISCKEGDDCGCDKDAPQFDPFRSLRPLVNLKYNCPQVRDLQSLAHWEFLKKLDLTGCRRVEMWPDFATMTGLRTLDLNYTSLKERPTSLLLLHGLEYLSMRGCKQLPAEELTKGINTLFETRLTRGHISWVKGSLQSLLHDLKARERDRCSVADALDSYYEELVGLFHVCSPGASSVRVETVHLILQIMYQVWFEQEEAAHVSISEVIATKLSRLLCSEKILSFPFYFIDWSEKLSTHATDYKNQSYVADDAMVCGLMGIAIIGASIGWYNAGVYDPPRNDSISPFLRWFTHVVTYDVSPKAFPWWVCWGTFDTELEVALFRKRVEEGVCKVAREPSVAAALGPDFLNKFIQPFEAHLGISHL